MNGQSTVNHSTNPTEQLIGKFHVVNIDKLPTNPINNSHDETANIAVSQQQSSVPQPASTSTTDESTCASRFQMIRVDRNFGRGRWKVNDYEPPENVSNSTNPPVSTIENESTNISNSTTSSAIPSTSTTTTNTTLASNVPTNLSTDSNAASSATLAATVATAAAATVTAFQQQQRLAMGNPAAMVPPQNVPSPASFHPYPPAALANMTAPNQSYLIPNHPLGYYPYFPPHYSPYAAQWAALAANPYLPPPIPASQLPAGNLGEQMRLADTGTDITGENPVISSNPFPNATADHLQNAQLAAAAASFIYAAHHPHSPYVPQLPPTTASPYSTIASYHPGPPPPTIIPPTTQPLSLPQIIPNNISDLQQQSQQGQPAQQSAPILTSPKHETSSIKNSNQQSNAPKAAPIPVPIPTASTTAPTKLPTTNSVNIDTLKTTNATHITDLLSSSPSIPNSQQPPPSLLSPIAVQAINPTKAATNSLNDIWSYGTTNSPLNLSHTTAQTAAATAVAAMGLLNNESSQSAEIASEILKELTTPTKQNISNFSLSERRARLRPRRQRSTTDIDNKISAAMDLVKAHLLSAVREEVTELRQQIRTLNEKVNSVEHENAFLRQHVPSEIYAQYVPLPVNLAAVNDGTNPSMTATTTTTNAVSSSSATSSQPIPMTSLSSVPASTTLQSASIPTPLPQSSTTNLPST